MTSQLEAPEKQDTHLDAFVSKKPTIEEIAKASEVEQLEYQLSQMPDGFFPTEHLFLPGMYLRKIFMPAGSLLTSMKHKTRHSFVIMSGKLRVMDQEGVVEYEAPFIGVTEAGTKRVLYIHEDTTWITFHANPENISEPDEMVEYLTYPNENPLFDKENRYKQERIEMMKTYTVNTINDFGGELS